jgi:DNA-binding SARP family transcriptional activator
MPFVCFGPFELDIEAAEVRADGRSLRLPEQQFQILHMLLLAQGGVVSRDEIRTRLWPNDTVVEFDRSINAAVMKLRIALGDTGDKPRDLSFRSIGKREICPKRLPAKLNRDPWLAARCLTIAFWESWVAAVWGWFTRAKT